MIPDRYGVVLFFHGPGREDMVTTRWRSHHSDTGMALRLRYTLRSGLENRMRMVRSSVRLRREVGSYGREPVMVMGLGEVMR